MSGCGRLKRLVCWPWHHNGHWTAEEIESAKRRAAELAAWWGYDAEAPNAAPQQPVSEESGER